MAESSEEISKMDETMNSSRPCNGAILENKIPNLSGRNPEKPKVYLKLAPFPNEVQLTKEQEEAYEITNSTTLLTKLPCSLDSMTIFGKESPQVKTVCRQYTFTETFSSERTQLELFDRVIKPQMTEFLAGQNCVTMTYGTINSGKSYTMQGSTSCPGIIPRSLEYIFSNINPDSSPYYKAHNNSNVMSLTTDERAAEEQRFSQASDVRHSVWISFAEIYNEKIFDLLLDDCEKRDRSLKLATDSQGHVFVKDLREVFVDSASEAYQVLKAGQCNLKFASTASNSHRSTSHCIFMITLLKYHRGDKPEQVEISRFSFCDLGGFELLKKTLNVGDRLRETGNINSSLMIVGRCLRAIFNGQMANECNERFRGSKVTHLFQHALSGKEMMTLIVNVNPLPNLYEETLSILHYAAIAKEIIIVRPKEPKLWNSVTRFSLIVEQTAEIETDWNDIALRMVAEDERIANDSTKLKEEDKENDLYVRQLDEIGECHNGNLVSRKRRHLHDYDDDDDGGEAMIARLQAENTRLTAENETLKKKIENIRLTAENETLKKQ